MKHIVGELLAARWIVLTLSVAGILACTTGVVSDDEADDTAEEGRRSFAASKSKCSGGVNFNWSYCSDSCRCGINEGDCDKDSHCEAGLKCWHNVGNLFFVAQLVDVCMPIDWKPTKCGTLSACEDTCVDLASDTLNCGACGNACQADEDCVEGACVVAEPSDTPCSLDSDCPTGEICQVGFCTFDAECPDGNCGTPPVCGDGTCDPTESCSSCEADCGPCSGGGGCGCGGGGGLPCIPATCADLGSNCGSADDGCGGTINCGTCVAGEHCDAGTCKPDGGSILVGCTSLTCADLGSNCGSADDGCGGTINCGTCQAGEHCDAGTCKPDGGILTGNICAGSCNKQVVVGSNTCWCDAICTRYKDCCQDANGTRGADHAYVDAGCP